MSVRRRRKNWKWLKWCKGGCACPKLPPLMPRTHWPWRWRMRRRWGDIVSPRRKEYEARETMITFLHGKLIESLPTQVTVEVNGVGYEVIIPLSSYDKLPQPGQPVKLLTHLAVREDAHVLYGFMSAAERELFRLLIHTLSGIGPKIALNVLT